MLPSFWLNRCCFTSCWLRPVPEGVCNPCFVFGSRFSQLPSATVQDLADCLRCWAGPKQKPGHAVLSPCPLGVTRSGSSRLAPTATNHEPTPACASMRQLPGDSAPLARPREPGPGPRPRRAAPGSSPRFPLPEGPGAKNDRTRAVLRISARPVGCQARLQGEISQRILVKLYESE